MLHRKVLSQKPKSSRKKVGRERGREERASRKGQKAHFCLSRFAVLGQEAQAVLSGIQEIKQNQPNKQTN